VADKDSRYKNPDGSKPEIIWSAPSTCPDSVT
jgi:hypothetical protein